MLKVLSEMTRWTVIGVGMALALTAVACGGSGGPRSQPAASTPGPVAL
jgi:hypothetical protein